MSDIKGSINSVVIGNCDTVWKAGIQFNQKNGCPTENLGHDVHIDEYAFYFETVDESTEHGDK